MTRSLALAALLFASAALYAANPIPQVIPCGQQGVAGGLGTGTELTRVTVDTVTFPEAVCNDGTPAVFYYGAATKPEDRNKWIIFLQGGGACFDGQTCAQRWCSIDTNYGMDKMTTSLTKPQIRGVGFMNPDPQNRFGTWNRVLIFYCSSDAWNGTATRTVQATLGNATGEFEIHFKGVRIIDAVLDTLRYASPRYRRRVVRHSTEESEVDATSWPDLDAADAVIFGGSSAGGGGVRSNLDRVAAKLRATNPTLDIRGVTDAVYATQSEFSDYTKTTYCANDPARGCSYEAFNKATRASINLGLYGSLDDVSCAQWHATNAPGTEWRCSDGEHVTMHHLSTPFFLRQDLQDPQIGGEFVAAGFGTPSEYAQRVESELRALPVPEEPRGATPGVFAPQCGDHEAFTTDEAVFRVRINGVNWHDAVWNWWTGAQPQQLVRKFTGTPGDAPECP
jgi:Pectinacetylesterase